jgi:hypothetical protein
MTTILQKVMNRIGQCGRAIRNRGKRAAALLALSALFSSPAFAQLTTADILGTVTDPSGAVVPNATITIINLGTNEQRTGQTSGSGDYTFTLLPVGHYSVTVKAPGFQSSVTKDLSVEAGDRARNDVHLSAGSEATTIEVQGTTPLLQADSATVSSTVTAQAVQDLPLNGRNFVQLVQIVPGANEGPGNGLTSGARPDDRRQTASFSVNGQDDTLNNFTIDGIDDNERIIGTIGVRPVVEGIQEITVQTNNYTAEAGRTAGGVVSIVTRAGTNQFHGTAYEYFRNDIFDARNVLQTSGKKPELRQNQFGGSIGGPIFKDRTFFFGDYEGLRQVTGVTYSKTTLTQAEYNDVHSLNGGSPQALLAAGNGTQGQPIDPVAFAYLSLYPAPNAGGPGALSNNYITSPSKTQTSNSFDVRVDHRFNQNNVFFGRYDYNKVDTFVPPGLGTDPVTGLQLSGGQFDFDGPATDTAQQYGFGFTHIFNPALLVDLRAAYTRINNLSLPLNTTLSKPADVILQGNNPGTFATNLNDRSRNLTPVGFPGLSDLGDGSFVPLQDIDSTFQYTGNVSWTKGNHNLKFGASLIRRQARNLQSPYVAGQYGFGLQTDSQGAAANNPTLQRDNGIASSLTGAFSGEQRQVDLFTPDYRTWEPSFFAQDSWKVTPKLTVLYGLRYDLFTPFTEAHNRISNFDFLQALTLNAGNIGNALKIASANGVDGHAGIKTDYSNVAPRLGFAYSITPQLILRGGFGISYFPGNYTSNTDLKNIPFLSNFQPNCQSAAAIAIESRFLNGGTVGNGGCAPNFAVFSQGLPQASAPDVSNLHNISPLSFGTEGSNFKSAAIDQFNLQIEKQFGPNVVTIGYVGLLGHHIPQVINDINQPAPYSTNPASPLYFGTLPNPGFRANSGPRRLDAQFPGTIDPVTGKQVPGNLTGVGLVQSEGISNYNGLQTSLQRRFSQGLSFDANYTWSKALNDATGYSEEGDNQGYSDADPFHLRQTEYGAGENDIRNRFALSANYEFQYGKTWTGVRKLALTGYHVNTIAVWQSGKPFSILNGGGNNDNTSFVDPNTGKTVNEAFGDRAVPNNGGGRDRPNQIADPHGNRSLHQFFNTAAFAPQPTGTIGSVQRNSLYGPNFRHIDLSLFKDFPVREGLNVQFRAESYNISNTPSYIIPLGSGNAQLGNTAFGTVTNFDPNYNPRLYQFALKLQF